jgi:hypothetical protein
LSLAANLAFADNRAASTAAVGDSVLIAAPLDLPMVVRRMLNELAVMQLDII